MEAHDRLAIRRGRAAAASLHDIQQSCDKIVIADPVPGNRRERRTGQICEANRCKSDPQFHVLIRDPARREMPICQKLKHLGQPIQAIKRGCRVVYPRRQGTLRNLHNPPERELDIVFGRALLTKRERIAKVVSNSFGDPAIGGCNNK